MRLQSPQTAAGESSLLFRLHGALMLAAWVGTASLGMLLARYYKQTWAGRQLAGVDLWFLGHRSLMQMTVGLMIGGLVCIVLQLGGWTSTPLLGAPGASAHPLLGVLAVALALLQPMMAMCRCHPGAPRRAIFNWLHWMVGSAAHILAVAAIFFAVELPAAKLPVWTYWVLAAFVVFHVLTHFILSVSRGALLSDDDGDDVCADVLLSDEHRPFRLVNGFMENPHTVPSGNCISAWYNWCMWGLILVLHIYPGADMCDRCLGRWRSAGRTGHHTATRAVAAERRITCATWA